MASLAGITVLFAIAAAALPPQAPPAVPPPRPAVAVSVLEVKALSADARSTRRLSYSFQFELVRTLEDGARVMEELGLVRDGALGFLSFQGADVQSGQDAATRMLALLDAQQSTRDRLGDTRRPYVLGDVGLLRLTILRRAPDAEDLWIFERADGRRATIAYGRSRP